MFNRRLSSFCYKIPKEIQPLEAAARLCYATTFQSYLALFFMERRSVTLHQMFDDAQEIEENFHACQKLPKQILDKNVGIVKDNEVCVEEQVVDSTFLGDLPIFD